MGHSAVNVGSTAGTVRDLLLAVAPDRLAAAGARRVPAIRDVAIDGLIDRFSEEVHFGERLGVIGPNGSGKSHIIRPLAGEPVTHDGAW